MTEILSPAESHLGRTVPADTAHAVSVSLPTWRCNVGYEEGEDWVLSRMTNGYPRFYINQTIAHLARLIGEKYAQPTENVMLLQSCNAGPRFLAFLERYGTLMGRQQGRILEFARASPPSTTSSGTEWPQVTAVAYPRSEQPVAKAFWQHTGEGIQSRKAEYCLRLFEDGAFLLKDIAEDLSRQCKAPRRYRKTAPSSEDTGLTGSNPYLISSKLDMEDGARFVEERFGRNLNIDLAESAKISIRRRIAGSIQIDHKQGPGTDTQPSSGRSAITSNLSEDDVYLYPCGMNSIYHTHRSLATLKGQRKSICFGFPYVDTLKILEKFGPGCVFYGHGSNEDLDSLETRLESGERFLALFCEFPSNPLLRTPDLKRIRALADAYDFYVVVDETIGNFLNVHILPFADVLVSSLTKIFSGDSNVMGGSAILNPNGQHYTELKGVWDQEYEDIYWPEDAIFMERNSRDFASRIVRINHNAEMLCDRLRAHPRIKNVYYPKVSPSRKYYDACKTTNGGYGGLLSATFYSTPEAAAFYDHLNTEKGPSLGTNFTLASPFVLLAHYGELDWAAQYGAELNLVRFSVGLEDSKDLQTRLDKALDALESAASANV